jgi:hypothetical protein
MGMDWQGRRATATRQITKFGAATVLRRADNGSERPCTACEVSVSASSRQGELRNMPERVFLIAADGAVLTSPPDPDKEHLIWGGKALRMIAPIDPLAPSGFVIYYEAQVKR